MKNLKLIREFKTPTDIIIFGGCYNNGEDYVKDVSITDDYCSFGISLNGETLVNRVDSEGFISVISLNEFVTHDIELKDDEIDYYLIKQYKGNVHLVVKQDNKSYDTAHVDSDEYIHFDCKFGGDEKDDDWYPSVFIDLSEPVVLEKLTETFLNKVTGKYKVLGVIDTVSFKDEGKGGMEGCIIEFKTNERLGKGAKVQMLYGKNYHYFEVAEIDITDDKKLVIKAKEVGYWARKFDKVKDLDLRDLLQSEVTLIEDEKMLNKIREMEGWC